MSGLARLVFIVGVGLLLCGYAFLAVLVGSVAGFFYLGLIITSVLVIGHYLYMSFKACEWGESSSIESKAILMALHSRFSTPQRSKGMLNPDQTMSRGAAPLPRRCGNRVVGRSDLGRKGGLAGTTRASGTRLVRPEA